MPDSEAPNFEALVRFLIQPLLDAPESLSVHCESLAGGKRIWVRVAFEGEDKGRVYGRGGRNIQAIRSVVTATGKLAGCEAHLDVFGEPTPGGGRSGGRSGGRNSGRSGSRPRPRPRSRDGGER
ncbi:MAG: KH domain-containing protein [Cyanobacteria bacterium J06648_16]